MHASTVRKYGVWGEMEAEREATSLSNDASTASGGTDGKGGHPFQVLATMKNVEDRHLLKRAAKYNDRKSFT